MRPWGPDGYWDRPPKGALVFSPDRTLVTLNPKIRIIQNNPKTRQTETTFQTCFFPHVCMSLLLIFIFQRLKSFLGSGSLLKLPRLSALSGWLTRPDRCMSLETLPMTIQRHTVDKESKTWQRCTGTHNTLDKK